MAVVGGYVGLSKALVAVFPVFLLAWLRFAIAAVAMAAGCAGRPGSRRSTRATAACSSSNRSSAISCSRSACCSASRRARRSPPASSWRRCRRSSRCSRGCCSASASTRASRWHRLRRRRIACRPGARRRRDPASGSLARQPAALRRGHLRGALRRHRQAPDRAIGPKRISALINLWGLALVTPFGLWQAPRFDFGAVAAASWALLLGYSIAASVLTVWLWMTGLRHVAASSAGIFTVLLPVSAAVVGVAWLGEHFSTVQTLAFGLALAGVVLATWPATPAARAERARRVPATSTSGGDPTRPGASGARPAGRCAGRACGATHATTARRASTSCSM